jgi:hypothetical protein
VLGPPANIGDVSNPGWYPDPGGQPGKFRYWDGAAWSARLTSNPQDDPPGPDEGTATVSPASGGRSRKWWVIGVAAAVALGVVIWLVVRFLPQQLGLDTPWDTPGGHSSASLCTAGVQNSTAAAQTTVDGRMTAGHLSTPLLGNPWETPTGDNRVPFGTYAVMQEALDQEAYDGTQGHNWVSSVLLSDLISGDGFANSQAAAETVMKCVLGLYYGDYTVQRSDISAKAHSVDGHDGWLIESQLSFDIPGLKATGERVLLLVVQTGTDNFGLFYASVPNTRPDRLTDARSTLAELRVEK